MAINLDNFSNWNLSWEQDYNAQTAGISRYYAFVIGEIIPPVSFTTNILAVQISVSFPANKNSGYAGYVKQKVSGTFSGYISNSYKRVYIGSTPTIIIFDPNVQDFLLSFTPIFEIQSMTLEIFEFMQSS